MLFDNSSLLFVKQSVKKPKKHNYIVIYLLSCYLPFCTIVNLCSNKHEVSLHVKRIFQIHET